MCWLGGAGSAVMSESGSVAGLRGSSSVVETVRRFAHHLSCL